LAAAVATMHTTDFIPLSSLMSHLLKWFVDSTSMASCVVCYVVMRISVITGTIAECAVVKVFNISQEW